MLEAAVLPRRAYARISISLVLFILYILTISTPSFAGVVEEVFAKDRNLLAISRYNNLSKTDTQVQDILASINPQTPTTTPVLSLLSEEILVDGIKDIDADNWAEALYFSQPLEKTNDWVYAFHIHSPESYTVALLGTGKIRQEQTVDGITRYRKTDDFSSDVYYLAYGDNNLAIMSKNSSAVKLAMNLYNDPETNKLGLITDSDSDYNLTLHLNRYFLANSRVLPNFFTMLHNDILRDLAGTTAKSDNILNLILNDLEASLKSLVSEIAIIDIKAYLSKKNIKIKSNVDIQYGGSLHYALSAYAIDGASFSNRIPANSIMLSELRLWPEEYMQIIEGIGNLGISLNTATIDQATIKKANTILTTFQEANPLYSQQGILVPDSETNLYGPVTVSVIGFSDSSKLPALFEDSTSLLSNGEYSEFLAEKGIKIELQSEVIGTSSANTSISETELSIRSTYFTLPDAFLSKQYVLSTIVGNHLITVIPLAPLNQSQYYNTRDFCLKALEATVLAVKSPENSQGSQLIKAATSYTTANTLFSLTLNPLRYIQVAMQSQAIWPSPSPPNRLPIPWGEFSEHFNSLDASTPPMNVTVTSNGTSLSVDFVIPKTTFTDIAQSLLSLTPDGGF